MPFTRPTLSTLIDNAERDFDARIDGADTRLRRSVLSVLARVLAGAVHGLYGYLDFNARQALPDTAQDEFLERHASIWGVGRLAATSATGSVDLTGTDGSVVPVGVVLQRADGAEFTVDAAVTITAGVATVAVTASTAGAAGETVAATTLDFQSPVPGVDATGTVATGGLTGGADRESDAKLQARLLARIQQPPHGGSESDYIAWAKEIAGVTRVWVLPDHLGAGTVGVAFTRDDDAGGPIPDAAEVQAVQDHIDVERPVTADVTVFAPVAQALNFTISVTPDTPAIRAAIEAELADLILREAEVAGTLLLTHIAEAISTAAGENDHTLTVPAADVTVAAGQLTTMGVVTWV